MLISVGVTTAAMAAGAPAGSVISNSIALSYTIDGRPATINSNTASFTVAELINVTLVIQDVAPVAANSPDLSRALTAVLTNTGNGSEAFRLLRDNAISGDQFDPINAAIGAIYLENGLEPGFQATGPNADTLYIPGSNDPSLAADASLVVYLVSDIPSGVATGGEGKVNVSANSLTQGASGATPGTVLPGLGTNGVDAVVGTSRATATTTGSYVVSGVSVVVAKSVVLVLDPRGGDLIMPGTVLTYRVVLSVSGNGTAANLALDDPLPAELSYVPGSITVNGVTRTDATDTDNADFTANTVNVRFGNTPSPATFTVEFRAKVN